MATPGLPVAIGPRKNYLDYPIGSPERAQLQAQEQQANRIAAQVEYAGAYQKRDELASLKSAEQRQRDDELRKRDDYNKAHSGWSGFGGRISDFFVHGLGKVAEVPFGITYDLLRASVRDDMDVLPTIASSLTQRIGGQTMNALMGPRGIAGSVIGMIPPSARDIARGGLQPVGEAIGNVRREAIIEPLLNLGYGRSPVAGLADLATQDPSLSRTLGRALVEGWNGNPDDGWGQVISGAVDLASAVWLDPAAGGAKVSHAVRTSVLEEAGYGLVKSAGALDHVVGSGAFQDFTERAVAGKTGPQIYNELLPNHPNGLAIGTVIEEAHKAAGVEGVKLATKAMLGDPEAAAQLAGKAEDAAVILDNASAHLDDVQESIKAYRAGRASPPMRYPEYAHLVAGEPAAAATKAEATRELAMAKRAQSMYGELDRIPRQTTAGRIRTGANALGEKIGSRSDWYQNSPYARPVHAVYDRLPKGRVNLNNPASTADLDRMLKAARMAPEEVDGWLGRYGQTVNATERRSIFEQAETASIKSLADHAGLGVDEVDALLNARGQGRASIAETLTKRIYGGDGRDLLVVDEADRPLTHIHIGTDAFGPDEYALTDFHQVRRVVSKWGQFKANHPTVGIPVSMLHEANDLWRLGTVAKISTSATIQMDQQFRVYMKLGAFSQIGSMASRGLNYIWDTVKGEAPEMRGVRPFEYRGVAGPGPWGRTAQEVETTKALNSGRGVQKLMTSAEIGQRKLFGSAEGARTIYPSQGDTHLRALADVLNNQIGDDPLNRMLLEGATTDEAVAWLNGGPAPTRAIPVEGRTYRLHRQDRLGANLDPMVRPQGTYYSLVEHEGFISPHLEAGGEVTQVTVLPKKPLDLEEITVKHARFGSGESGVADAGVTALKKLVSKAEFERLAVMPAEDLIAEMERKFSGFDYGAMRSGLERGHADAYDALSAYGAQIARREGYDALVLRDPQFPDLSEYVALKRSGAAPAPSGREPMTTMTAEAYTKTVPFKRRDPQGWVEARAQHIEDMTAGNPELRALALDRKVTANDIASELPDPATRPMVNRLLSDNMTAKSQILQSVQKITDGFFRAVQSWPDDVLSRNTLYSELYNSEMERLIDVYAGGKVPRFGRKGLVTIPDNVVEQFSKVARTKSLNTTRNLLYDLADQSRAAEILRFAVPFFEPVREQATVFAQLANEAPTRYLRVMALLRAPLRAGLITDERGNRIREDGKHVDPLTGEVLPESQWGTREMLRFNLPGWARGVPWFGEALGGKTISLDMGSIRAGMPQSIGFGPVLQIPVNQVARKRPDLQESLKFILPYGTTDASLLRQMEPSFVKKFADAQNRDDDNRTMRGLEASSLLAKITSFRQTNGRVPSANEKLQLEKEAVDEARSIMHLRAVVGYTVPFSIGFDSPYKPYADAYRTANSVWSEAEKNKAQTGGVNLSLADAGGLERTPDQWFVDTFGEEYYALTQSVTKTQNGVPATVGGVVAEKKYRDLIEKYPDLGGLIIGSEGVGEFNHTIFLNQLGTETRPGSGVKEREYLPLSGAPGRPGISTSPEVSQGWAEFGPAMDVIDAIRRQRGLSSLNSKAAADLAAAKNGIIDALSKKYPAWADEYGQSDSNKWKRKIEGMTAIADDPRLAGRGEIAVLKEYLEARQGIAAVLASRKNKTLSAQSNADVDAAWTGISEVLIDKNLAFADLYHRYLERDPVVTP